MHVYSHQLKDDGSIKQPAGAPPQSAIPCYMVTSANYWPDRLCTIAQQNLRVEGRIAVVTGDPPSPRQCAIKASRLHAPGTLLNRETRLQALTPSTLASP